MNKNFIIVVFIIFIFFSWVFLTYFIMKDNIKNDYNNLDNYFNISVNETNTNYISRHKFLNNKGERKEWVEKYKNNKNILKELNNMWEQEFIEHLDLCYFISNIDFSDKNWQKAFIENTSINDLYNSFKSWKLNNYSSCLNADWTMKTECNDLGRFNDNDVLLASYLSWKDTLNDTWNYLLDIIKKQEKTDPVNSLLLKILKEKLFWNKITYNDCDSYFMWR